jgi:hypothetical protein
MPTPAAAHGQGVFPLEEEPTANANEALVDSFGEAITPEDLKLENQSAPPPQFAGGMLVPPAPAPAPAPTAAPDVAIAAPPSITAVADQSVPVSAPDTTPAATAKSPLAAVTNIVKEAGQAVQAQKTSNAAGAGSLTGLPLPIIVVIHLAIFVLIGLAVFALWHSQYKTIANLDTQKRELINNVNSQNQTIANLQNELILIQQQAAATPIFISGDVSYSFYRNIPDLRMVPLEDGSGAILEYGEVVDGVPTSGFTLKIEGKQANGLGLEQIVDQEMAEVITGATRVDKKDENYGDKVGFSYLERNNDGGKVIYFFRNSTWATFYVRLEFTQAWKTQAELNDYNEAIGLIMSSLKIYKN